jgi:DNA-binding NtrC family response regulator
MKKKLHLLILEDNPADAELAVRELEKEDFLIEWSLVETKEAFREALNQKPEVILADYNLPSFDGLSALKIKQEISPTIPLIIISGIIGEEFATECIKAGATDYVLKDKLFRLVPVIKRALQEAEEHRERKQWRVQTCKSPI